MGAARLYKAGTPYNAIDLAEIDYAQTADVVFFAHMDYPPEKAVRAGHTDWTFSAVAFAPSTSPPTSLDVNVLNPNQPTQNYFPVNAKYKVAAVDSGGQESRPSNSDQGSNDLTLRGNYNSVAWLPSTDAIYYKVYKSENETSYGYVGIAETTQFIDGNGGIPPDYADGPRVGDNPFVGTGNYPSTVTLHQQRVWWARSRNLPNVVWASQVAAFENMDRSRPGKADDALAFGIVSDRVNSVNHLASMKSLIALTSDAIFALNGGGEGTAITAQQIVATKQVGRGSRRLKPIAIDNTLLFRPSQGSSVRAFGYTFEIDGYKSDNVAIFSPHFFNGYQIVAWAYQQEPFSCVWAVRSDGKLLCLTWEQEQQVWGWTLCETSGTVEDVAVISERGMDRCYLAVRRTLGGVESVFIERMALPLLTAADLHGTCHLDCAVTQKTEAPTNTITGLWHLEGEAVTVFADGYVVEDQVVENGRITLDFEASTITAGLPYSGEIETLPNAFAQSPDAHVARQMTGHVVLRVKDTRGLKVGVGGENSDGTLFEVKQRDTEELDEAIDLDTADYHEDLSAVWNNGSTVRVVQDYPLPATITAMFPKWKGTK